MYKTVKARYKTVNARYKTVNATYKTVNPKQVGDDDDVGEAVGKA